MSLLELRDRAIELAAGGRAILGVAGSPGSGKTTFAMALSDAVAERRGTDWVAYLPMDGFHLADVQLDRLGLRDVKGSPDTFDADGYAALLDRVRADEGRFTYAPGFERDLEQPIAAALVVPPTARLVITEGNYLLLDGLRWQAVARQCAEIWFLRADDELRRKRLIDRHVEFGKRPAAAVAWVERSDDANARLVEESAYRADRVVVETADGWEFAG